MSNLNKRSDQEREARADLLRLRDRELAELRKGLEDLLAITQEGPTAMFYQREIRAALAVRGDTEQEHKR